MMNLRLRRPLGLLAIALPVAIAACSLKTEAPTAIVEVPIESTTFAPTLGVDLAHSTKTADGLYYRDITVGTGTVVEPGTRVSVRYLGQFANGQVFDSSATMTTYLNFVQGAPGYIAGFEEGVLGMKVGGSRQLIIPSALGYGAAGRGTVPPYAVLVYRLDLIGAQ